GKTPTLMGHMTKYIPGIVPRVTEPLPSPRGTLAGKADPADHGKARPREPMTRGTLRAALRPPAVSYVAAIGLLLSAIVLEGQRHPGMDSTVYQAGAQAILRGHPLYGALDIPLPWAELPFTYPPIAAVFFLPLVPLPLWLVWGVMAAICALSLGVVVRT